MMEPGEPLVSEATKVTPSEAPDGPRVQTDEPEQQPTSGTAHPSTDLEQPFLGQSEPAAAEPEQKTQPCCRKPTCREMAFFSFGFLLSLLLVGLGIFIFIRATSDGSSSAHIVPLATPHVLSVLPSHPGWLTVGWQGAQGSEQWRLEQHSGNHSQQFTVEGSQQFVAAALEAEHTYCFRVQAFNAAQSSEWSDVVCNKTSVVSVPGRSASPDLVSMSSNALVVQVFGAQLLDGHPDNGGDNQLSYWGEIQTCGAVSDSSSCDKPVMIQADDNKTITLYNASGYAAAIFSGFSRNAAGLSPISGGLVCVNMSQLSGVATLPLWSCSRSAAPSRPELNITQHTVTGFTMNWTPSSASSASSIQHYVVQVDDWWDHKAGLLTTVSTLNSDARQFTLSDPHKIIPGSSYQVRVGAVDNQDTASWSSVTTVKVDDNGACGNPADLLQQRNRITSMKHDIQVSLLTCEFNPNRVQCATDKVSSVMDWSQACAKCWVNEGLCVQSNCLAKCLSPESQACDQCARDNCFVALNQCTGIPDWTYPP